jgi:LDH2 family malate/lactate/ureidoglycolate dehydrogenase
VKTWIDAPEQPQSLGHFFFLIDTRPLGPASWLAGRMKDFIAILHATPPTDPAVPVIVPGEIGFANMARQQREGISIERALLALLEEHGARA